jgi:hypothetical protein
VRIARRPRATAAGAAAAQRGPQSLARRSRARRRERAGCRRQHLAAAVTRHRSAAPERRWPRWRPPGERGAIGRPH